MPRGEVAAGTTNRAPPTVGGVRFTSGADRTVVRTRLIALLAVAGLLSACSSTGHAATPAPSTATAVSTTSTPPRCEVASQIKLTRDNLNVGGEHRYALVHIPAHWNGQTAIPLVLSFHGLGASAV